MKKTIRRTMAKAAMLMGMAWLLSSCSEWIYDDREGCDHGVWLSFKYDYNLQRADMFDEHVGGVQVYVYDEQGRFVTSCTDEPTAQAGPYRMYIDLPEGNYRFIALAHQCSFDQVQEGDGAHFQVDGAETWDDVLSDLTVTLDHQPTGDGHGEVMHEGCPLDTLWHAIGDEVLHVPTDRYVYDTLSLVRDTKSISISLREVDDPAQMDVADYDFHITHRNLVMNCDFEPADESLVGSYTPHAVWNTSDADAAPSTATRTDDVGCTAHADFMTSRLYADALSAGTAQLTVTHRETGEAVIEADLINLIGQLRNYDETQRYSLQEFLDRGYDYRLTFFLKGGTWQYVNVSIGVLGWSKRIQNVAL